MNTPVQIIVGRNVRAERGRAGISQVELARRVGVVPNTISRVENGHSDPSVGLLCRIADHLFIPVDRLLEGSESGSAPGTLAA